MTSIFAYARREAITSLEELPLLEWIEIPTGTVKIEGVSYAVPPYKIGKYPVTAAQYAPFVADGGYHRREYWPRDGWEWRLMERIRRPRYWHHPKWHRADYPVVGISWFEAVAYCNWLSANTDWRVSLPTEEQWQRAAQGDDGRTFPWGNDFDPQRCNHFSRSTTPVTKYAKGASPFGVMDMSGNVWEWCLNVWETNKPGPTTLEGGTDVLRATRGGSWAILMLLYHSTFIRSWNYPSLRLHARGFRLVRA